jgi:hypothetical protein
LAAFDVTPEDQFAYGIPPIFAIRTTVITNRSECCPQANALSLHFLRHGKSSMAFGRYRKTNPQNGKDHIGDPGRQQMKGCRNHHN